MSCSSRCAHLVEHAHRVQTLHLLSRGRLRFGVGAGSTRADFDAVDADYEARFKTLPRTLEIMRRTWNGDAVFGPPLPPWPGTEGGPQVLLGAWRSARWIRLAAETCQGWIASGIFSEWDDLQAGLRRYRAAGGTRAVLANVFADLRVGAAPDHSAARARITLHGPVAEARQRLRRIEQLGFDDVLLVCPFEAPEQLEALRALI